MTNIKVWFIVIGIFTSGICAMRVGGGIETRMNTRSAEIAAWGRIDRAHADRMNKVKAAEREALSPTIVFFKQALIWTLGFAVNVVIVGVAFAIVFNAWKVGVAIRKFIEARLEYKAKLIYPDRKTLQLPVVVHQTENAMLIFDLSTGKTKRLAADTLDEIADPMMITANTSVKNNHISTRNNKKGLILNG